MSTLTAELRLPGEFAPETKNSPHYPALDGLRAVAVLMVLVVHASQSLLPWGWMGVQVFFVLSGFLITGILFDARHATNRYRVFYARRALRIFPLYYAVLSLTVLASYHGARPSHIWLWFVYLQNFPWLLPSMHGFTDVIRTQGGYPFALIGHFWTLAVEEQFYFLWPFLVYTLGSRQRIKRACYFLIGLRFVIAVAVWHFLPAISAKGFSFRMLPTQWDGFLLGALLALRLRDGTDQRARLPRLPRPDLAALAAILSYAVLLVVLTHLGRPALNYSSGFQSVLGLSFANLVALAFLVAVLTPKSFAYRLCMLAPMKLIGRVSYGFYVFHPSVILMLRNPVENFMARHTRHGGKLTLVIVSGALTLGISYISFRFFESPILSLRRHFVAE